MWACRRTTVIDASTYILTEKSDLHLGDAKIFLACV